MKSPQPVKTIFRPWLWPQRILSKCFASKIPWDLRFINFFVQRIIGVNLGTPWAVHFTSRVIGKVVIGKNVERSFAVSGGCYFQGINGIYIGDNTIFAPGVKVISANHRQDVVGDNGHITCNPIKIGIGVWIGTNAVILPGVTIGDYAIIGAGAIVNKDIPSYGIAVGNPAQVIKYRELPKKSL